MFETPYVFDFQGSARVMLQANAAEPTLDRLKAAGMDGRIDWPGLSSSYNPDTAEELAVIRLPNASFQDVIRFLHA